jgi:hypothetical protein
LTSDIRDLISVVSSLRLQPEDVRTRVRAIGGEVLTRSKYLSTENFKAIHPADLELLFHEYDKRFFDGLCRKSLNERDLMFRLSPRLTRAGGKTTRFRSASGKTSYEIAIAVSMLFDGFRDGDRSVTACGSACETRLEALQRIFEHELVHLIEHLCWEDSDCSGTRFQDIAARTFSHRAHTHSLITWSERAASVGIRAGAHVTFAFEGQRLSGRVNRVTKRATVLVLDPEGQPFSDGCRYRTYYVPLSQLQLVTTAGA